jgi:CRP/FNR family transcriptional regulator, anaerobic regulatory protein
MLNKYKAFLDIAEKFIPLSFEDKEFITNLLKIEDFSTGEVFLKKGIVESRIGLVLEGIFMYYFVDENGNEVVSDFMPEDTFVTNIHSFIEHKPSFGTIIAEGPSRVILINRTEWDLIVAKVPNWNRFFMEMTSKAILEKASFARTILNQDAKSSYTYFMKKFPSAVNQVQVKHIASFLGITHFSLSRIRKQIAQV